MKISRYIFDKWLTLIIYLVSYFIILGMAVAFKVTGNLIIAVSAVYFLMGISCLLTDYIRKKSFYDEFINNTELLDKKYLVPETLRKPDFYEGEIIYQNLYEISKYMTERVSDYSQSINDFKEYIEMWIHEVKLPISSLVLMCHNNKDNVDEKYIRQIKRLDNYADQVLYYIRSNYAENDYLLKEIELDKVIGSVLIKNKDDLLENKINVSVEECNTSVISDGKWIEFILNQIVNNSIKYKRDNTKSVIIFTAEENKKQVKLSIYDNGIGIPQKDLTRVFNKAYTGENGRKGAKSTGIGLYIVKKLCDKLGHTIDIESAPNQWTRVNIYFGKNDFYKINDGNVTKM